MSDKKSDKPAAEQKQSKKAEKPAKEEKPVFVTTRDLAERLGTKQTILRRFLRSLPKFQDSGYTKYKWEPGDPFLNDIAESFKKYQSSAADKKADRQKEAEAKKAQKAEGKKTEGKKAVKKSEPVEEEDGDDIMDEGDAEEELE